MTRRPARTVLKPSRRRLLEGAGALATTMSLGSLWPAAAAALVPTPRQTAGPFYPTTLPLDRDNDLVRVSGHDGNALGTVTHVFGRVLDMTGWPVPEARIEIWQCDAQGRYLHPADPGRRARDAGFQGYGQTVSTADGSYRFRTIRPVPYAGRTPHIHFAIQGPGFEPLVTQMYVAGEPRNEEDFVLNRIRDPRARASVIVPLEPAPDIEASALAGTFNIVLGRAA